MSRFKIVALIAAGAVLLGGCAGTPEVPYDRGTSKIHIIGLIRPAIGDGPVVARASSLGMSFGLVGGVVEASLQSKRDLKFQQSIASEQFLAKDELWADLHRDLSALGYQVVDIDDFRGTAEFHDSYSSKQYVDAYLDVVVNYFGYVSAGMGSDTPYRPTLYAGIKLVRAKDRGLMMQDAVAYNLVNAAKGVITISPDPAFVFADSDVLSADPVKAVNGLRECVSAVSKAIASLVK